MDRRRFVRDSAGALVATAIVGCGGGGGADPATGPRPGSGGGGPGATTPGVTVAGNVITVNLTIQTSLTATNGFLLIPEARTFVFHLGNTNYKAFTSVCTHEMCDVNAFASGRIRCPCHGSQYDQFGQVVVGPATAPLRQFTTSLSGTTLTITTN